MTEGYLESRGIAYRTNAFESGRPTLLFIHGLSGSLSAWYPYEKIFQNKYNLITFDVRGHGLSKRWPNLKDYTLKESVEDIRALMKQMGIKDAILIGHSLGTLIALDFVTTYPAQVRSLVLLATAADLQNMRRTKLTACLLVLANRILRFFPMINREHTRIDYSFFPDTEDFDLKRIYFDVTNTGFHAYCYSLEHIYEFKDAALWQKVQVPALLVHGTKDTYIPVAHAEGLSKRMPDAKLIILPGANHILVVNNIGEVAKAIGDFIG